jgi:hypothetical protein
VPGARQAAGRPTPPQLPSAPTSARPLGPKTTSATMPTRMASGAPTPRKDIEVTCVPARRSAAGLHGRGRGPSARGQGAGRACTRPPCGTRPRRRPPSAARLRSGHPVVTRRPGGARASARRGRGPSLPAPVATAARLKSLAPWKPLIWEAFRLDRLSAGEAAAARRGSVRAEQTTMTGRAVCRAAVNGFCRRAAIAAAPDGSPGDACCCAGALAGGGQGGSGLAIQGRRGAACGVCGARAGAGNSGAVAPRQRPLKHRGARRGVLAGRPARVRARRSRRPGVQRTARAATHAANVLSGGRWPLRSSGTCFSACVGAALRCGSAALAERLTLAAGCRGMGP